MGAASQRAEKLREAAMSVLPMAAIVLVLCFSVAPVSTDLMLSFLIGAAFLILGLGLFMYGSDQSMSLIGNYIGAKLTATRKIWLILSVSFLLGVIITMAEPDLSVLAGNVPHIDSTVLVVMVSLGVGLFLMLCMLRILLGIPLRILLLISYGLIFLLAAFSDRNFISVAFDSGGVTTGPMTAPFIIALGVGVSSVRSDKDAEENSFGLVALCSAGPILAVLILGFLYPAEQGEIAAAAAGSYADTVEVSLSYLREIPASMAEVARALLPILVFFLIFQAVLLKLPRTSVVPILIGLAYTYVGLVIFLTGVNVGFSSLGMILGECLASRWTYPLLIPVFACMGWFVVRAEPAVHVLNRQVEEISAGAVSAKAMELALSLAIALAMALSMVRVLTGLSLFWFVIPGYAISLALAFVVPPLFTAIAFDSGGVASGPMSAAFMLPFAMGVCRTVGGNLLTDAFGVVAMVAMMPLLTVQMMGVFSVLQARRPKEEPAFSVPEDEVIELWAPGLGKGAEA